MTIKGNRGFIVVVGRRIFELRKAVKFDTQRLRTKTIERLDRLFAIATSIANGEVIMQRIGKKRVPITPKQRQMWAHVATHIAMVMGNLAKGYDEVRFDEDLAELERLVDEIKKQNKVQETQAKAGGDEQQKSNFEPHPA